MLSEGFAHAAGPFACCALRGCDCTKYHLVPGVVPNLAPGLATFLAADFAFDLVPDLAPDPLPDLVQDVAPDFVPVRANSVRDVVPA